MNLSPESAKCDPRGSTSLNYVHRTCLIGIIEGERSDLHYFLRQGSHGEPVFLGTLPAPTPRVLRLLEVDVH